VIVIVDKSIGKCRYLKTVGISSDEKEIAELYQQGKKWIAMHSGDRDMFAEHLRRQEEKQATEHLLDNIENILKHLAVHAFVNPQANREQSII
jgi:hypothetical protein